MGTWGCCSLGLHCHWPVLQTGNRYCQSERSCVRGGGKGAGRSSALWPSAVSIPTDLPAGDNGLTEAPHRAERISSQPHCDITDLQLVQVIAVFAVFHHASEHQQSRPVADKAVGGTARGDVASNSWDEPLVGGCGGGGARDTESSMPSTLTLLATLLTQTLSPQVLCSPPRDRWGSIIRDVPIRRQRTTDESYQVLSDKNISSFKFKNKHTVITAIRLVDDCQRYKHQCYIC